MRLTTLEALNAAQAENRNRRGRRTLIAAALSAATIGAYLWRIESGPFHINGIALHVTPLEFLSIMVYVLIAMIAAVGLQQVELQQAHRTRMRFYRDVTADITERTGIEVPLEAIRADHGTTLTHATRDSEQIPVQLAFIGDTHPVDVKVLAPQES